MREKYHTKKITKKNNSKELELKKKDNISISPSIIVFLDEVSKLISKEIAAEFDENIISLKSRKGIIYE